MKSNRDPSFHCERFKFEISFQITGIIIVVIIRQASRLAGRQAGKKLALGGGNDYNDSAVTM